MRELSSFSPGLFHLYELIPVVALVVYSPMSIGVAKGLLKKSTTMELFDQGITENIRVARSRTAELCTSPAILVQISKCVKDIDL